MPACLQLFCWCLPACLSFTHGCSAGSAMASLTFLVHPFLYHIPARQSTWKCFESVLETCWAAKTVEK